MHDKLSDAAPCHALMHADERLDDLQLAGMHILQKTVGFRFGMDAVLLADFTNTGSSARVADFGTGTGILPLLLLGHGKAAHVDALEIQEDMADMAARSMRINGLDQRCHVHHLAVEEAGEEIPRCSLDAIVCNPPYGVPGTTLRNPSQTLSTARHQSKDGLQAWFQMGYQLLKGKGRFHMIYPAPRMLEAMQGLEKAHLAPKRFRLIYPGPNKPANLVLIEAMKDARPLLHPMPPLIIYKEDGSMTKELQRIYQPHLLNSSAPE